MYVNCCKFHGCGNDFIIIDENDKINYKDFSSKVCERYSGIGADMLIVVANDNKWVRFFNSDGSEAPMCGNGIRCAFDYILNIKKCVLEENKIKTNSGTRYVEVCKNNNYKINMGKPSYLLNDLDVDTTLLDTNQEKIKDYKVKYKNNEYALNAIFMTTHHLVIITNDFDIDDEVGAFFCNHKLFKKGINVNFVKVLNKDEVVIRTYERGVGWTNACGSGTTASFVILNNKGLVNEKMQAIYKYGILEISKEGEFYYMKGPSQLIAKDIKYSYQKKLS